MRLLKSISIILVTGTFSVNAQAISAARFSSYCGLMQNKIYCYGGSTGSKSDEVPDATMFVLDISTANGTGMSDLASNWRIVTPNTAGVNTENRQGSQCAVVGGTQLVLSGGFGGFDINTRIVDQTIAYNVGSNSWKKYPNYIEGSFGNRQIYWASVSEVPSKGLAYYGGFEHHISSNWSNPVVTNNTAVEFNKGYSRAAGYTSVVFLDITNANNPWSIPTQTNTPKIFTALHTSVFHPASNKLFFFGGTYEDVSLPNYMPAALDHWHQLSYSLTFDTTSSTWGNQSLAGASIPTPRSYHSTTLLPNGGQNTVLLYGGERSDIASSDFCYTLDLKTFTWTQQSINANYVDLIRSRHSAILSNNNSLFIVFGFNSIANATSLPIVLNVSNPVAITYLDKYTDPNAFLVPTGVNNNTNGAQTPVADTHRGLSAGAIAGIAVGAAVVGILACAIIIFCLRKKRAGQKNREAVTAQQSTATNDLGHNTLEVNWDEIEKQYSEIPTTTKPTEGFHSTAIVSSSPNSFSRDENASTTITGSERHNASPLAYHTTLASPPDAMNEAQHQPFILKPDGANYS